ncbi:hypothetical protein [Bacillus safensis]|uniref:hypothetical protein n=1 Tax=Bacillus safensis TaxID=561879 RepID=UPI0009099A8A|nr:hypothetical protein [Bacillus safensis]APJ13363.1 hypothetical protein BSL056_20420 [Bacillus safensis]
MLEITEIDGKTYGIIKLHLDIQNEETETEEGTGITLAPGVEVTIGMYLQMMYEAAQNMDQAKFEEISKHLEEWTFLKRIGCCSYPLTVDKNGTLKGYCGSVSLHRE